LSDKDRFDKLTINSPLLILGHKLRSLGPPSLTTLIARLEETREYDEFRFLVKEFLPEREREIIGEQTPGAQIAKFVSYFQDRYFPLEEYLAYDVEEYAQLVSSIPVVVLGMSYDDYECIPSDSRPGIQLMAYLIECPYDDGGTRVALAEACREHVPVELLKQVPENGISLDEAHRLFNGTRYKGLAIWADMLNCNTGNFFLDTDYEMMGSSMGIEWSREDVDDLTRQWRQAESLSKKAYDLSYKIDKQPEKLFKEIIEFISKKKGVNSCPASGKK